MIKRSSKLFVDNLLKNNPNWNILDIGCGYSADKNANVICDIQDLSNFYKDKKFIKLINAKLPFKDKEFDFVIASHVLEHVEDLNSFIKELERVALRGYIELPTKLEDNLVFENKKEHLWQVVFDDVKNELIFSKRIQHLEPLITVSTAKQILKYFRQSLVLELIWEKSIEYKFIETDKNIDFKISRISLLRKFISKLIRNILR